MILIPIRILSQDSMHPHPHPLIYASNVCIKFRCAPERLQPNGRRALHLIHHLFSAGDHDQQGVIASRQLSSLKKKVFPHPHEVSLKLSEKGSNQTTIMTLSEALTRLGPCTYLTKAGAQPKKDDSLGVYRIEQLPNPEVVQPPKKRAIPKGYYKRSGRGKEIHLTTACAPSTLRHRLILAYKFLLEGSRLEVHLHEPQGNKADSIDRALTHSLQLRPDTILAAMPRDTTMLALPATSDFSHRAKRSANAKRGMAELMWAMENGEALRRVKAPTSHKIKILGQWKHIRGEDPRRRLTRHHVSKYKKSIKMQALASLPPKTPESSATP